MIDGLPELEDAFNRFFVKADIERCIMHKVRNTIRKVREKDIPQMLAYSPITIISKLFEKLPILLTRLSDSTKKYEGLLKPRTHFPMKMLLVKLSTSR